MIHQKMERLCHNCKHSKTWLSTKAANEPKVTLEKLQRSTAQTGGPLLFAHFTILSFMLERQEC